MSASKPTTTTAEALLGLLSVGPRTGYELKQRIDFGISNFWSESFGQIYPALKKLEADGFVTSAEEGRAGRRVYTISASGRERLGVWLAAPAKNQVPRNELLLKLMFGRNARVSTLQAHVEAHRDECAAGLKQYEMQQAYLRQTYPAAPDLPYWMITLNFGIRRLRAQMEWAEETLAALGELTHQTDPGRKPLPFAQRTEPRDDRPRSPHAR